MKLHVEDEEKLKRYLLAQLTLEEQLSVQEQLFLDAEYLQRLQAVEDELIDDYVYDELTANERERFESHFLSQLGRDKDLRFAKALKRYTSEAPSQMREPASRPLNISQPPASLKVLFKAFVFKQRPVIGLSLAAIALLILSSLIWLALVSVRRDGQSPSVQIQQPAEPQTEPIGQQESQQTTNNIQENRAPTQDYKGNVNQQIDNRNTTANKRTEQARREAGPSHASSLRAREPVTQELAIMIYPGGVVRGEGAETNNVTLSSRVTHVILRLPLVEEGSYHSYRATLQTEGRTLQTWHNLKPTARESGKIKIVALRIPVKLLQRQSYQVKMGGASANGQIEDITTYHFQVTRPPAH